MEEKKKKKIMAPRLGMLPFLSIWILGHIFIWVSLYGLGEMGAFDHLPDMGIALFIGSIMGIGIPALQKALIQFTYYNALKWWMRASLIGWVLGWVIFWEVENSHLFRDFPFSVHFLAIVLPPALIQWFFILREHTRNSWLWVLAGAVSGMAFGAMFGDTSNDGTYIFGISAAAQGAVTGLTMLWLFGQNRSHTSNHP